MNPSADCHICPAFGAYCEGVAEGAGRCREIEPWLDAVGGLDLDMDLSPQPDFELPRFFPQLLNGLEVPSVLSEPAIGVGIAKALTPHGKVSRRAIPVRYGPQDLRAQWGLGEETTLLCIGNTSDGYLERLWPAQRQENVFGRIQALGFNAATSLNFSIYLDHPRLEHLINIKRTWLTVRRMQETSRLIPIPHLQWATPLALERQLDYAQEQGFHTLTMNLQMTKRQGWDVVALGFPLIRAQSPDLRFLFTGVASLKRMKQLVSTFPGSSFTNTTAHYLAQRHVRLQRDDTRLIKEPVDGHPDLILAESVRLYQEFLTSMNGHKPQSQVPPTPVLSRSPERSEGAVEGTADSLRTALNEVVTMLRQQFGFDFMAAHDAFNLLATDEAILSAFRAWLRSGELDRDFRGSFPTWPCSDCVPHPTLGQLLDESADPIDAFLHLAYLAHQVDEELQAFVGQAGY